MMVTEPSNNVLVRQLYYYSIINFVNFSFND